MKRIIITIAILVLSTSSPLFAQDYIGAWRTKMTKDNDSGLFSAVTLSLSEDSTFVISYSYVTGNRSCLMYSATGTYEVSGKMLYLYSQAKGLTTGIIINGEWYPCDRNQTIYTLWGNGLDESISVNALNDQGKGFYRMVPERLEILLSDKDHFNTTEWEMIPFYPMPAEIKPQVQKKTETKAAVDSSANVQVDKKQESKDTASVVSQTIVEETKNTETAPVSRKAAKADTVNTASNVNENTAQVGNKDYTEPKETKADKKKKTVVVENTGTSSSNLSIGIVLGANMSRLASNEQGYDSFGPKTAFDAGLFANLRLIPMNNNKGLLGLQSEVHYSMMGGKTDDTSLGLNYITIPIMLRLYPINNLYIEAGPMPALNIGHNPESIEMGPAEYHLENMKANDVMFVAGAGASFGGVSIGLRYCHGMSDIAANMPWKNQAFQIQVSYGFPIGGR